MSHTTQGRGVVKRRGIPVRMLPSDAQRALDWLKAKPGRRIVAHREKAGDEFAIDSVSPNSHVTKAALLKLIEEGHVQIHRIDGRREEYRVCRA